jgi:hypothetical protein
VLSIPDRNSHKTKLADWLELSCVCAPDGRIGFGTLVSASDMSRDEQPEDITEDDLWEDDLVISAQEEIDNRLKCIGDDYPFRVTESGDAMGLLENLTGAGAVYLFCLFLSHAVDRDIIPASLAPQVDNAARDLFQVCATIAAAGYVKGNAISFGWPRPQGDDFLQALNRVYHLIGDGLPHATLRPAAPEEAKDDGIDVIAWRPQPDGLAGMQYLLGQVASGDNWKGKSVVAVADAFHDYWFERPPASKHENAMFMPFCLEPQGHDDGSTPQELLVDHMQRLTHKFGTLFYRYRMAHHAAEGLRIHSGGRFRVERIGDLPKVIDWVQTYSTTLRGV